MASYMCDSFSGVTHYSNVRKCYNFNLQVSTISLNFGNKIFQRLCRMSCDDARTVIDAVSVHNDKLVVLDCIKR